ncbi:MAG: DUF6157 family protein [Dermatophilaceae bacterium]
MAVVRKTGRVHTTDYANTLITVAPDTRATRGIAPPSGKRTVAQRQYALLVAHDYELTSDDVLFAVHCDRLGIEMDAGDEARSAFFARGQPCLRTSPLVKTYGWGIHSDAAGRIALVGMESERYAAFVADDATVKTAGMRIGRR